MIKFHHLHPEKTGEKNILLSTNRTFRPHGLPQQNREQSSLFAEEAREGETSCLYLSFFSGLFWMQMIKFQLRNSTLCPALLALQSKLVAVLSGDVVFLCQVLCSDSHWQLDVSVC